MPLTKWENRKTANLTNSFGLCIYLGHKSKWNKQNII